MDSARSVPAVIAAIAACGYGISRRAKCLQVFEVHTDRVYSTLLASDGRAVSGSRDGTVRVWDIETGRCLRVLDAHRTHVQCLAWNKDEQHVISCSLHIRLWDLKSGRCLQALEHHRDTIRTVEWSPDQRLVLSASHDRTVRIWEAGSGRCVKVLEGHPTLVVNAAWSADQRQMSLATRTRRSGFGTGPRNHSESAEGS